EKPESNTALHIVPILSHAQHQATLPLDLQLQEKKELWKQS
ncbi:19640_t:CDS:1, partial [Racocetra persica]